MNRSLFFFVILSLMISCENPADKSHLFIPENIVIAHRGTTYWAPEETEAAYRWARDIGAHYLEVDIQRSKDGVLMALHDNQLTRTTNINQIFSTRDSLPSSVFTFEELMQLDAGSWFNKRFPERAQNKFSSNAKVSQTHAEVYYFDENGNRKNKQFEEVFTGGKQQILALEDVIRIAEGYRIAKDAQGNRLYEKWEKNGETLYRFFYIKDQDDQGHRPGVYIETREPQLFPGVEKDLFDELDRMGWNQLTKISTDEAIMKNSKVNIGNTSARIILQTFSPNSLKELYQLFQGKIPTTFLLWLGDPNMPKNDSVTYFENLKFAQTYGATIIGPSIGGEPNNYSDLLNPSNYKWIREQGFYIHPYSFDTQEQMQKYGKRCDGMFTNRADLTLEYYTNCISK